VKTLKIYPHFKFGVENQIYFGAATCDDFRLFEALNFIIGFSSWLNGISEIGIKAEFLKSGGK
jgi:hypothetical protein